MAKPNLILWAILALTWPVSTFDMKFTRGEHADPSKQVDLECLNSCIGKCPPTLLEMDLGVSCLSSCVTGCMPVVDRKKRDQTLADKLKDQPPFYCTNGKDPAGKPYKQMLREFAKGPCVPVILAPGVMATRMTINIDCNLFREKEARMFERCGWNACEKSFYEFWKKVPKEEYLLWIPELLSDISIMGFSEKTSICFAALMKPHFDPDRPIEKMAKPREGLTIRVYGFSEGTKPYGNCGNSAIENLLPLPVQTAKTEGFRDLSAALVRAGYVPGLTMQAIPYNFYYSYRLNEFKMAFRYNLLRLNLYTGKKVTIIAHSMGNMNTLYNLSLMKARDKKRLIHNWISIAAPFIGSAKGQKILVTGSDEFITFKGMFGFHFLPFITTVTNQMSMYEIAAVNPFQSLPRDDPFIIAMQRRMVYEARFPNVEYKDSGFLFWPPVSEVCYDRHIRFMPTTCRMKLPDLDAWPMMKIGEEVYKISDSLDMMRKHQLSSNTMVFMEKVYNPNFAMTFPEVPVIVVFANAIETPFYYEFGQDLDDLIRQEKFPQPERVGYVYGDKTVPSYSTLLPSLRWAFAFDNRKPDDPIQHQPIKFVEFCSRYKRDVPVYDDRDPDEPYQIKRNGYIGVECECSDRRRGDDYSSCEHANMHADVYLVDFILKALDANYEASAQALEDIENLKEEDLAANMAECNNIRSGIFV